MHAIYILAILVFVSRLLHLPRYWLGFGPAKMLAALPLLYLL